MLCFRCGSPVEEDQEVCPNCGQDLSDGGASDGESFVGLQRSLRKAATAEHGAYKTGDLIAERYEILDVIGAGALGVVYKSLDREVEVDVAIKVIGSEHIPDAEARETFVSRFGKLRQVVHDNVVRLFDVGIDQEHCFFVTQFLEGLSLRKIADLRREKGQRFALSEVEPICGQVCDALGSARLVHGGLKPENVIILPDLLKVTDAGLVSALPPGAFVAAQLRSDYLAPEVRVGKSLDPRADVYSIAALMVELLCGDLAHGAAGLEELDEIPGSFVELVSAALEEDPELRPSAPSELGDLLAPAIAGESVTPSGARGARRKTLPFSAGAALEAPEGAAELQAGSVGDAAEASASAGDSAEDERPTVPLTKSDPSQPDGASAPKEVTQQLSVDDLEVLDDVAAEAPANGKSTEVTARTTVPQDDADPDEGSGKNLLGEGAEAGQATEADAELVEAGPRESTQQLSLDDVEFSEDDAEASPAAGERANDEEVTVPRASREQALAPLEEPREEELFPTDPQTERTQQVEAEMILEGAAGEDTNVDGLGEEVLTERAGTESLGRDRAAVSGETDSSVRPMPRPPESDEFVFPHQQRSQRVDQEARARDMLQAFDAGDDDKTSERSLPPLRPADSEDMIEAAEAPEAEEARAPIVAVPTDVIEAAGPSELSAPTLVPGRGGGMPPWVVGVLIGLAIGAGLAVILVTATDQDESPPGPTASSEAPKQVEPVTAVARTGPRVQPISSSDAAAGRADAGGAGHGDAATVPSAQASSSTTGVAPTSAPTPGREQVKPPAVKEGQKARPTAKRTLAKKNEPQPGQKERVSPGGAKAKKRERAAQTTSTDTRRTRRDSAKGSAKANSQTGKVAKSSNKCHAGMVHIKGRGGGEGHCIDRYEAPGRGRLPRRVSFPAAKAACRARGLRICTAKEWMRACAGLFPYGRVYQAKRCNTAGKEPVAAGSKKGCRSRYGVYDLSGNVSEWVDGGRAMGGHFASAQGHASCMARTGGGAHTGYRCCSDPSWD